MKDQWGNEFNANNVHCWNCEHFQDVSDSAFS